MSGEDQAKEDPSFGHTRPRSLSPSEKLPVEEANRSASGRARFPTSAFLVGTPRSSAFGRLDSLEPDLPYKPILPRENPENRRNRRSYPPREVPDALFSNPQREVPDWLALARGKDARNVVRARIAELQAPRMPAPPRTEQTPVEFARPPPLPPPLPSPEEVPRVEYRYCTTGTRGTQGTTGREVPREEVLLAQHMRARMHEMRNVRPDNLVVGSIEYMARRWDLVYRQRASLRDPGARTRGLEKVLALSEEDLHTADIGTLESALQVRGLPTHGSRDDLVRRLRTAMLGFEEVPLAAYQ